MLSDAETRPLSSPPGPAAQGYCVGFHYDENKALALLPGKELQETSCTEPGTAAHVRSGSCYKGLSLPLSKMRHGQGKISNKQQQIYFWKAFALWLAHRRVSRLCFPA